MTSNNTPTKIIIKVKYNKDIKELRYKRVAHYTEGVSHLASKQLIYKPLLHYNAKIPITSPHDSNRYDLEMNPDVYLGEKVLHKYCGAAGFIFYVGPCHSSRNTHLKPGEQTCAEVLWDMLRIFHKKGPAVPPKSSELLPVEAVVKLVPEVSLPPVKTGMKSLFEVVILDLSWLWIFVFITILLCTIFIATSILLSRHFANLELSKKTCMNLRTFSEKNFVVAGSALSCGLLLLHKNESLAAIMILLGWYILLFTWHPRKVK